MLAVGASADGLAQVEALLAALPEGLQLPVAIACERDSDERDALLRRLQAASRLSVVEPDDKDDLEPGRVYLAPAGYHLIVEDGTAALACDALPASPSAAALFESAADSYGASALAVLCCGGGSLPEGAEEALAHLRALGGFSLRAGGQESFAALLDELRRQPGKDDRGRGD
jgi:two-component system chemotaxis response regulator CheB